MMKHKDVGAQKGYELLYYYITRTLLRHASTFGKKMIFIEMYTSGILFFKKKDQVRETKFQTKYQK